MSESLFSPSWYRISKLQPRLRGHAQIHRHYYYGELWYVLQDQVRGQYYRFTPVVYHVIGLMDGKLTVHELWEKAIEQFGDDAPTQEDMVRLLSQLHSADVLLCGVQPDTAELLRRHEKVEKSLWKINLRSPLALRFPLINPDRFLNRTIKFVRPFLSVYGFFLWFALVGTAVVLAGLHWSELSKNITDRVLSTKNLFMMVVIYPFIKILHEFGHGYSVKRWGGEVHEMGIMFLVLMPLPYVDASSALALREKSKRIMISAAGMMTELFVAALALFLWINLEPGIIRSIAYNVVFIASVSTVLFNINPLLRYDGYYILSDLVEAPNLAQRSIQYLGYLFKRYLFRLKKTEPPYVGPGERFWLVVYSIASFIYRIFLYAAIILFVAGKFFIIGIALGIWAFCSMVLIPVLKRIQFIVFSPLLRERRVHAIVLAGALCLVILYGLLVMPFPLWTRTEGIIWVPEGSIVRAGTGCFVSQITARPQTPVRKGEVLILCEDPLLITQVKEQEAHLRELEAQYTAEIYTDLVQAKIIREEITHVQADLGRAKEQLAELTIHSPGDGIFVLPRAEDLPGRYVSQGDLIAYLINMDRPTVRVVVPQSSIDLVRQRNKGLEIRFAERLDKTIPAVVKREVPGAVESLPSTTLSRGGGGDIAVDPRDAKGLKTMEKLFQFDIEPAIAVDTARIGERVYVRFDHGYEPLGLQWYRDIRRLFLRRFNV